MSGVDEDAFKGALGSWAAGVTVVATTHEGLSYGITRVQLLLTFTRTRRLCWSASRMATGSNR